MHEEIDLDDLAVKPVVEVWREAAADARIARDNYLAAIHGQRSPEQIHLADPEVTTGLAESYSTYLYQRMVQAALAYADAANREMVAREAIDLQP